MRREGGLVTHRSTDGIIPLTKGGNSVRRSIFFFNAAEMVVTRKRVKDSSLRRGRRFHVRPNKSRWRLL